MQKINKTIKILNFSKRYLIAGVDEVGRGALVGSVVSAAVILNPQYNIVGLTDSKKLNEKSRLILYNKIRKYSLSWSIGSATEQEIDRLNILQATMLSMKRAVCNLSIKPNLILVDGNTAPKFYIPSKTIIQGDSKNYSISAASIIAKVSRDKEMINLDVKFPMYGFSKNKGYPTAWHLKQLSIYGPTIYHRHSFKPIRKLLV